MEQKLWLIFGYAAVMLVAGLVLSKNKTLQDFLIAGRSNPGFIMAAGMVIGSIDAFWFTLFSGMGYSMGWAFIWVILGVVLGFFALSFAADKIKEVSTAQHMLTLSDWFYHHYGQKTGRVASSIVVLNFLGWLTAVFVSAGLIISTIFKIDYSLVIVGGALVSLSLLLKGGYASLTRFDVLQFFIVAAGLMLVYAFGFKEGHAVAVPDFGTVTTLGLWGTLSILLTMFGAVFAGGDIWQRIYAAKDAQETKIGFRWAYLFFAASMLATGLFGMTAKEHGYTGSENDVFAFTFDQLLNGHAQSLFLIILMAAVISTLNVTIFGASMSLAKDFFRQGVHDEILHSRVRVIMVAVVILCSSAALFTQDVMTIGMAVMSSTACFTPLLFISLLTPFRLHGNTAFISTAISLLVFLGLIITDNMRPEFSALPLAINLVLIIVIEPIARTIARYRR